ncbi:MAG: SUMF1/EgtB/PvdO family nonheme iron enzyme, partial [Pseudomonadota bacterium]
YLEFAASVEVRGLGETQRLDIELIPAYAAVSVTTEPAGATVVSLSDNVALAAATPAVITLPAGRQRVRFELPGYKPVERTYAVFPNTAATASPIVLEPADATLVVQSRPRGASVTVDGRYRGRTPLTLALEPGQRAQLRLTSPGYRAATRSVLLQSDEQRTITVPLTAQLGEITIRTVPVDAAIYINGREAGRGTLTVTLPSEPQSITVKREGFVDWQRTVTPRPGFAQTIDAEMVTPQQVADRQFEQQITVANGHELQYVSPGTFQIGTSRRDADRRDNEALRDVRLTAGFYIGKHEVTNEQFAAFRRTHPRGGQVYSAMAGDDNPVVNVSWQDAAAYCNWLSEQEGRDPAYVGKFGELVLSSSPTNGYRLPTEAEWVWVARYAGAEGQPKVFGWGDSMPPENGVTNVADQTATGLLTNLLKGYRDGYPATAPVGKFDPNSLGIFDLDGNVSEWVQDWYAASVPQGPLINPKGPRSGTGHVVRGPSWRDSNVQRLRLAFRELGNGAAYDVGFRIVRPVN